MIRLRQVLSIALLWLSTAALADEGMWTYNHFPAEQVQQKYGFAPTQEWLDHLRLSAVRIAGGCSASVVSGSGLVMTNHHCARACIENLSGLRHKDFDRDGFYAASPADEARCQGMEIDQLTAISNVTERVRQATADVAAQDFADAQKAAMAGIEKQCATSDEVRCEVVGMYGGGRYDLYRYRRFQDVRLVFAPEDAIADFGGDPDNFMFPRYALDVAFVRIYGPDGRPMAMDHHLAWSDGSTHEGDLSFVAGNPGGTSRGQTLAQLDDERDVRLPKWMSRASELRGYFTMYQTRGAEQKRHSNELLLDVENWLKAMKGQQAALVDKGFHDELAAAEQSFRTKVAVDPALAGRYGATWDRIAALVAQDQALRPEYDALERGVQSELFKIARGLVRYADEIAKPDGERLKEYTDARLPQFRQSLLAQRAIYDEFEIARLAWALTRLREDLGTDHPVVQKIFGSRSPSEVATAAVEGSRLKDIETDASGNPTGGYRKALFDGGAAAIRGSTDPMIVLARSFDAEARAVRRRLETEVEGPMKQQQELLAQARFAVYGEGVYPDATFSPRLSYGTVKGYVEAGRTIAPFTTLGGVFERATGADPFALPASWLAAKSRLQLDLPMNFVTDNDIIGGNSGSPVVNRQGEIVGLVFDSNIHGLGNDYGFDEVLSRTVAVHSAALIEALDKVYGAGRLLEELRARPAVISGSHD